jgi:diaminopimelate epimerase
MRPIAFHKYEGLGNDFVLVEAEREDAVSPEIARRVCDRRFGVGGDGVILVLPPANGGSVARMRVLNADGSVPEMCGNGLRCVALHLARAKGRGEIAVDTDAGTKLCRIAPDDMVTVDMGVVRFLEETTLTLDGTTWELALADAGNPHAITTQPASRLVIDTVGPRIATHPRFPSGTNVEFASFRGDDVELVVWERGVGVTHACGTGACATVAVGVQRGLLRHGVEARVALPGGVLGIMLEKDGRAIMRGPARHVFSGTTAGGGR